MGQIAKRGGVYHLSSTLGGKRLRCSLGVRIPEPARTLSRQISAALLEGPKSQHWRTLRMVLPPQSYKTLTGRIHLVSPAIREFQKRYEESTERRMRLGELAPSSMELYIKTAATFFRWLEENGVREMDKITSEVVDQYLVWRTDCIAQRGGSGTGIVTDRTVLQGIFAQAIEDDLLKKSPLRRHKAPPQSAGASPFSPEEMEKLTHATDEDNWTAFLLLRHTGMRCSDILGVTWESINWATKTLTWRTKKRKTVVHIPLVEGLYHHLLRNKRNSGVILSGWSRESLYRMVRELGRKAGVEKAHPHRFRDSRAVSILANGGTIYDVARILGISVSTADKFYSSFTEQLQNRVREIMEREG